ncbi:basic salivary proline-rich protein 3-like [Cavia porcellus]|uniref:basic salivary proline-rich protein 3-like n=1 Tax=Cavia porcellus TaxID=10141 RepID=UPI002FE02B46
MTKPLPTRELTTRLHLLQPRHHPRVLGSPGRDAGDTRSGTRPGGPAWPRGEDSRARAGAEGALTPQAQRPDVRPAGLRGSPPSGVGFCSCLAPRLADRVGASVTAGQYPSAAGGPGAGWPCTPPPAPPRPPPAAGAQTLPVRGARWAPQLPVPAGDSRTASPPAGLHPDSKCNINSFKKRET